MDNNYESSSLGSVAIIGMNGRFPGAADMDEFWQNLCNGVESVRFFTRDELEKMGIDKHLLDNPRFVAADAILDGMDQFDASFFDFSAREAEIMDPQHRLFLESAWEVMESAGYSSELYDGRIAVYAGANLSGYMIRNLYSNPGLVENVGTFKIMIDNSQDFLATRVSYKMNLMGPSVNVNTLCSSSMVALHFACQSLLNYACDLALAGGVSFQISRNEAFFYQEGGIGSADGHCRAFDSKANGTVSGSGLAVVVLKRLEDAIADGDYIHAVIRGTGVNNDGSSKNSFTAPNVDGQAECIAEAIAISGIDPETISYIDAHGTGTDLGDPIEIAALTKVFRSYTDKRQFCGIGSVKTNIGHLVTAGGMASLVKTVLSMKHGMLPPSLNFEEPNKKIDFANSPFYINNMLKKWETDGVPLRAGVSSFGIGGTNVHAILEEAPASRPSQKSLREWQLVSFSAKTAAALEKMSNNLISYCDKNSGSDLADIAFTLHVGRRKFNHRRMVLCRDVNELASQLRSQGQEAVYSRFKKPGELEVVFMFPGEASAYANMGSELYKTEAVFRQAADECCDIFMTLSGIDMRKLLYTSARQAYGSGWDGETRRTAVFVTEYALSRLWMEWEVKPDYLVGEGVGEYVAACLAGVMSLEDAIALSCCKPAVVHDRLGSLKLNAPEIPFVSNITGTWITDSDALSSGYWIRQSEGSEFMKGFGEALNSSHRMLVEMGPGCRLCGEAEKLLMQDEGQCVINAMPGCDDDRGEGFCLLRAIGRLWLEGGAVNWNKLYAGETRSRIPLPTYPFERQRYWIEEGNRGEAADKPDAFIASSEDINSIGAGSKYSEGTITLTFRLDKDVDPLNGEEQRDRLEGILKFKEKLTELCEDFKNICPEIDVSQVGLKACGKDSNALEGLGSKLKKRPRPELETPYVPVADGIEKTIADHWQQVLGFDKVGRHDDFFELGGHSLLAAAIATELSKDFNVQIPLRKLFETTTVAGVAQLIEAYRWADEAAGESAAGEDDIERGTI
ncbi:acyl transferase family protein [Anaerobacterium chartisolvens]|uniref:Acyl transferase family protein n=1 Tax=Anaerobacterium chartisolvens TaxID=1297424 RepID=A0A369AYQ2_9FIRM|nr:type I polyketide synthase [Anaerobacterium chartisolvens]RCX14281.1 acyl transferase family protein [Anaerobacterium chartisolvens]